MEKSERELIKALEQLEVIFGIWISAIDTRQWLYFAHAQ